METFVRRYVAKCFTLLGIFVLLIVGLSFGAHPVEAAVTTREDVGLDENLSDKEGDVYAPVQKILIAQIPVPSGVRFGDSKDLYEGLFYYSIVHLGFMDIPFNYVVTWQGMVYEGKSGGADVQPLLSPNVDDSFKDSVLIGYYGNNQEITYAAKRALVDLTSDIQSYSGVSDEGIVPVIVSLASRDEEAAPAKLQVTESIDGLWNGIVKEVAQLSSSSASTEGMKILGTVEDKTYNTEVKANENFVVSATIKNTGTIPWYGKGTHAVYLATSNPRNHESPFFVTDKWLSFARVGVAKESWVLPGEVGTFSFEIETPLRPGQYTETFELLRAPDMWVEGSQFEISFNVTEGGYDLIEILDTETGYLNVRECPSSGCAEIGKVVPGEVLIKTGLDGNWYKIRLDDGREGWIFGKYVRDI